MAAVACAGAAAEQTAVIGVETAVPVAETATSAPLPTSTPAAVPTETEAASPAGPVTPTTAPEVATQVPAPTSTIAPVPTTIAATATSVPTPVPVAKPTQVPVPTPTPSPTSTPFPPTPTSVPPIQRTTQFVPLDNPVFVAANAAPARVKPDSFVLGLDWNGEVRAYPLDMMWWHHLANDTIGGDPVVVTY